LFTDQLSAPLFAAKSESLPSALLEDQTGSVQVWLLGVVVVVVGATVVVVVGATVVVVVGATVVVVVRAPFGMAWKSSR
jgi:hypothetical protein